MEDTTEKYFQKKNFFLILCFGLKITKESGSLLSQSRMTSIAHRSL